MRFQELIDSDEFLVITELEPPKGIDTAPFLKHAESLKGRAHAVLVPEMNGAIMRMGALGSSVMLKQKGIEPIVNIHCRDRNRLALQADVLTASALGLENITVTAGDEITSGDHLDAKAVNDLDVLDLLETINKLQRGTDMMGNELLGIPSYNIGSDVNAGLQRGALELEVLEMEKKIKAGANYFFTPTIYDVGAFKKFMDKVGQFKVPVFPRITILKSVGMARFMGRHMEGVLIPDDVIDRLAKSPDKAKGGIEIAGDTIKALQDVCRGVLLVAISGEERLSAVLDHAGL
jgi:5,10-methylenetetrahydrofolate reductase